MIALGITDVLFARNRQQSSGLTSTCANQGGRGYPNAITHWGELVIVVEKVIIGGLLITTSV